MSPQTPQSIRDLLVGKNAKERATIKGVEIAKAASKLKGKKLKIDKKTGLWK